MCRREPDDDPYLPDPDEGWQSDREADRQETEGWKDEFDLW